VQFVYADSSGDRFFAASGVEHPQHNKDQCRFHRVAFYSQLKCKVGNIVDKVTALCINFDIDDAPIVSHAHSPHQLTNLSPPLHFSVFPTIGESGFI
jgi:hypothetical protein